MAKFEAQLMIYLLIAISIVFNGCYSWKRSIVNHHRHSKDCKKEGNKKHEAIIATTPKATAKITTMSLLNTTFINNISMLGKKLKIGLFEIDFTMAKFEAKLMIYSLISKES